LAHRAAGGYDRGVRSRTAAAVVFSALVACLFGATSAVAQPRPEGETEVERARFHFMAGRAYYDDARYDDAAREFEEAYRLTRHPDVLYNLGLTYERMGRSRDAVVHYRQYLDEAPDGPERAQIVDRIRRLEAEAGPVPVERPDARPPPAPRTPHTDDRGAPVLGWSLVAGGGAVGIGALITGVLAASTHADLEESCEGRVCPRDRADDIDSGQTMSTVSTVLTAVAVAAAAVGVVLVVTF
jgi:tetratricopeptide (TPR) repeat protein